ncbi:MAG: flavodoxin [Bacteroidales bacterium]|nr:flavodoxin [Bacteroidales bacterium]
MKHINLSIILTLLLVIPFIACAKDDNNLVDLDESTDNTSNGKYLVVYFSCTNTTKGIADKIAKILEADEFRIEPADPYTSDDLNYSDNNCRANKEQNDANVRPAIVKGVDNIGDYDIIYVGFPIWWGKMPKIMFTFFDTYDLSGKTIIPFCTSGSSGINTAINEIKSLEPNAEIVNGNRFSGGTTESTIKSWIDRVTTDIAKVEQENENSKIGYNIRGQVIDKKTTKELIIIKGKKYVNVD